MTSYLSFDDETKTLLNKKSQSHNLVIDKNSIIKTISEEMISQLCYYNILKTLIKIYGKRKPQSEEHYF